MNVSRNNAPRWRRQQPCPLQACWSRLSRSQNWPAHRTCSLLLLRSCTLLNIHVYINILIRVHIYTFYLPQLPTEEHILLYYCVLFCCYANNFSHTDLPQMPTWEPVLVCCCILWRCCIYIYTHSYTCTYKHAFVVYVRKCSPLLLQFLMLMRRNLPSALSTRQQRLSTLTCAHLEHVLICGCIFLRCSANMFHQNWYVYVRTVSLSIDLCPCFCLSWKELLPK